MTLTIPILVDNVTLADIFVGKTVSTGTMRLV
jgi:hypothetical protein